MATTFRDVKCIHSIVCISNHTARNNMISTIDITWDKSLEDQQKFATTRLKNKSNQEKSQIKQHYTELVDRKIQNERSLDKSSFRILPVQNQSLRYHQYPNPLTQNQQFHSQRLSVSNNRKSVFLSNHCPQNEPSRGHLTSREILQPVSVKPQLKSSSNLSRTVFGYEINPQNFKRESYLTKILSDRLEPYLEQVTSTHKRHKSVMTNQIIDLGY